MVHTLKREQKIRRPLREVFSFFERPENLARITPESLGFKILTPPPIVMRVGTLLDYKIRILGLPIRWRTLITTYSPPFRFVDEQLRGPYDFWHHTHSFEEIPEGTLMRDEVRYALGMGPFGTLMQGFYVGKVLDRIFEYRARVIGKFFDDAGVSQAVGQASGKL